MSRVDKRPIKAQTPERRSAAMTALADEWEDPQRRDDKKRRVDDQVGLVEWIGAIGTSFPTEDEEGDFSEVIDTDFWNTEQIGEPDEDEDDADLIEAARSLELDQSGSLKLQA